MLIGPVGVSYPFGADFVPTVTPISDYYGMQLLEGHTLTIETSTPADGPGDFVNKLDPTINVYDGGHNLVASDDNSAADGRNALLVLDLPAGDYFIEVVGRAAR